MTRRALSPAARGVLLAVSAAMRGRVVSITDAPDGTTHAVVREADGTVLLDCRVRSVSGRRDDRQPSLPLSPGMRQETPAPVAMVREAAPEVARVEAERPRRRQRPARLTAEPDADALARHGEWSIVGIVHEGGAWELLWSTSHHGGMAREVAWDGARAGHRAREYNRGQHCTRDSADRSAP